MKKYLIFIILFFCSLLTKAQTNNNNFDENYNQLMKYLETENWVSSDSLSNSLLKNIENDGLMDQEKKVLRYIIIYSNAGLLNENKISKAEALGKVIGFKNLDISLPAHPVNSKGAFNYTKLETERANTLFTMVNNSKGTQIFCFEHTKMKELIDEESIKILEGKNIAISGKLKEIKVEGNMFPRFNLEIEQGEMSIIEE